MHLIHQLLVLLQLVAFAALLGGCLVQLRAVAPEVNLAMVYGAGLQLLAGLALFFLDDLGGGTTAYVRAAVQFVLAVAVLVLVVANRKFADIPRGLLGLLTALTVANAAVEVLWV